MKRKKMLIATTTIFSLLMATTAFAGTWQTGTGANQNKWWYDNGDGTYVQNGWQWIDGNSDGVAESYYFDANGWLLTNTTTLDGYTVNESGAWVENGVVQAKAINTSVTVAPISENDFIVSGDNSVTRNTTDNSIITNWIRTGYSASPYHVFVTGDSLTTARGISLENTKNDVVAKYGNVTSQNYNSASDKWYQYMAAAGNAETSIISAASSVMEYSTNPYGIRFYFDQQDILTGVVFFRDTTVPNTSGTSAPENAAMFLTEGYYRYYKTDIFDENTQKTVSNGHIYDGTRESEDEVLQNDRYPFQLVASPVMNMKIGKVSDNSFTAYYEEAPENAEYFNENTSWAVVYNKDGDKWRPVGSESEPDFYCVIDDKDTFTLYNTYNLIDPETVEATGQVYTEICTYKRIQ